MTPRLVYPFEHVEVTLKGQRWQATGTAVLLVDIDQVYTEAGLIAIEQVDRLTDSGELEFEDVPWSLWEPEERLALVGALEIKINAKDLNQWYYERTMNDE